jgi:2-methylisocitrate lyase-like PEP mutase family enzyme
VNQKLLAEQFRAYHKKGAPILVLPTAWDAASARLIENCGGKAIATTSLGMANVLGYSDGEQFVPWEDYLWLAERMIRAVRVPVSLDIEAGYGDVERATQDVIRIGAVGLNIEDRPADGQHLRSIDDAVKVIKSIRKVAERSGVPIVINARTDALAVGNSIEDAIERGNAYLDAGADCVFPVHLHSTEEITKIVGEIRGPVNVIPRPGMPAVAELAAIGVRRVSTPLFRAAMSFVEKATREFLVHGTLELVGKQQPYPDLNALHRFHEA